MPKSSHDKLTYPTSLLLGWRRAKRLKQLSLRLLTCLTVGASLTAGITGPTAQAAAMPRLVLQWPAHGVSQRVKQRVESLLAKRASVEVLPWGQACDDRCATAPLRLALQPDPSALPESFQLNASRLQSQTLISVHGTGRGLLYGLYASLERLGYRFWHPLETYVPPQLTLPEPFVAKESPAYKARGFAHHTMHPLELAHVLNGWGPAGPQDATGWQALLPEWEGYLEWLIAQRQNKVEWVLLEKAPWADFARSPERQARLRQLVTLGHDWQVQIGIDAPLTLEQQNGWRLIPKPGSQELEQLRANLDWLVGTGLDFVTTEMGTSEFTHGGAKGMLEMLNVATAHLAEKSIPFYTKVHISSGQETTEFSDPQTGGPLNVNFLPYFADPRLGIMPHTVQIYALDDPAPTYGHQNFAEMRRFMHMSSGQRSMLWFPETAYWVNYDVHVPLFLPVYARQRLHDLRLLQADKLDLDGQIIFSSGWEHGYWLNDLLAARAIWNPGEPSHSEHETMAKLLREQFDPYGPATEPLVSLIQDTMDLQHRLLVLGQHALQAPANIQLRSGIAYLAGQDTWSQLGGMLRSLGLKGYQTQPDRIEFEALIKDPAARALYRTEIAPLLQAMVTDFSELARRAKVLKQRVPNDLRPWYAEFDNSLALNALRARQVYHLMEASVAKGLGQSGLVQARLDEALDSLRQAEPLAIEQAANYRSDPQRLAGFDIPNPTVYRYGYLWPARSLYFWKRDWLQVAQSQFHPCYLNIIDPLVVALPDPDTDARAMLARTLGPALGLGDCLHPDNPELIWNQR